MEYYRFITIKIWIIVLWYVWQTVTELHFDNYLVPICDILVQYLELRFGKTMRSFTTLIFVLAVLLILPVFSFLAAFAFARSKFECCTFVQKFCFILFANITYNMLLFLRRESQSVA